MPKVSIIVPCWGVEKYLDRCVESLVNQTLKDIEIILVDDVSPDRVPEMCDEWARKDNRIVVVHKKENGGLGMACNSGIEVAKGEYIAFCDSDDWVDLNMYETMYFAAKENEADIVSTGIQTIDAEGIIKPMNEPAKYEVIRDRNKILCYAMDMIASEPSCAIERKIAMSAKIVLYRNSMIKDNCLKFESERKLISEDLIWNLDNYGHAKCIVTIPHTFYYYYDNSQSITKRINPNRFLLYKQLHQELIKRTKILGYPDSINTRIDRMFIGYIRHLVGILLLSGETIGKTKDSIKAMLSDPTTQSVLYNYPSDKMPIILRISYYLMRKRCVIGLYFMFKIKSWHSNK